MKNKIIFLASVLLFGVPLITSAFISECTGGTVTYAGGQVIHTFTTSGTLNCNGTGGGNVNYLVVGGGGGGGANNWGNYGGGGGGAGGYRTGNTYPINSQSYSVIVGSGGAGGTPNGTLAQNGGDSVFNTITAVGGGRGAGDGAPNNPSSWVGGNGGSGGGGTHQSLGGSATVSQGNDGGNAAPSANYGGGGGGGAGSAGGSASTNGGDGGDGLGNSISGSSVTYAGGGAGSTDDSYGGAGGAGGIGGGGSVVAGVGQNGTNGLGGGGGGTQVSGNGSNGGNGGSGVVIISYSTTTAVIEGSGILNRLAKFNSTTTISNSLLSDDGTNTTLISGNFFMPLSSLFDTSSGGSLNFGTSNATTMTFGRSGQNMIINSKVGISTSSPVSLLSVAGDFFANTINILAGGLGIDTYTSGLLSIGGTSATSINIGRANATSTFLGPLKVTNVNTVSNCNSTSSPAVCSSSPAGSIAVPTGNNSTLIVNTTAVTPDSQIFITEDSSLGLRLGITCNTITGRTYSVSARSAGTSFTIKANGNILISKACLSYFIVN